ncbi:hypothetical protein IEN85_01180 [Pelagicoccus sp. NFK12]|uniref:Uncharacterized protein n=1 Tax=Pelagicoccus enzymogenes TaxID=2773457 RepID=A0A927F5L7_9BACT|nr:hypothetical protein [Pelagicoccus enzymogenes]MBD5778106.1 hypothetical protein [Pelagicoccus enzymogenes]MDQ8198138.1 hypothetical protein [Pelagicoccus enzymogenes]
MDPINSNPFFNSARLYQNQQPQQKPNPSVDNAFATSELRNSQTPPAENAAYSNLFDDDALLKLQSNLEAIAQMAEQSLKRIDS